MNKKTSPTHSLTFTVEIDAGCAELWKSAIRFLERDPKPLEDILNPPTRLKVLLKALSMNHEKPFTVDEYQLMDALLKYAIATHDRGLLAELKKHVASTYDGSLPTNPLLTGMAIFNSPFNSKFMGCLDKRSLRG